MSARSLSRMRPSIAATLPAALAVLIASAIAFTVPRALGQPNGDPQTQPEETRIAGLVATLRTARPELTARQDATRLAVAAQAVAINEVVVLLVIPPEGLFSDPWAIDLEHLTALDSSIATAPQDAEYDRSLQEYASLLATRQKLDRLNRWKLRNEAALSFMATWADRVQRVQREIVELQDARRALTTALAALTPARTAYATARAELVTAIGSDDPRLTEFPDLSDGLLIEASAAAAASGLKTQGAVSFLSDMVNAFHGLRVTLEQHRSERRVQEDLLFERRSLLERTLHRKTRGLVATTSRGLDLGELAPLFDEAEALSGRLNIGRDLLLQGRLEEILVKHGAFLLVGEAERAARIEPMQPLPADPLAPIVAGLDGWRREYTAFTRIDDAGETSGPLDAYINGIDGEIRRIDLFNEGERRSIVGLSSDFAAVDEKIREGVSVLERESELDALKSFFQLQRDRASKRLYAIDAHISTQRQQRAELTEDLTKWNGEIPALLVAIADAEAALEAEPNMTRKVQLWASLYTRQGDLAALRNRISLIESEITILETAEAELGEDRVRLQGLAQFWEQRVTAVGVRIEQRLADERAVAAEAQSEADSVTLKRWIAVLIAIVIAALIVWGVRLLGRNINKQLDAAEKRHQKARYQRVRTIMVFVRGLVTILTLTCAFVAILFIVGIGEDVIQWLVGSVGVIALAVSFGAQSLVKDFFSGFFILFENQYVQGDWIKIGDVDGNVEFVGLRTTVLRDFAGNRHVFNNGSISHVCNMSARFARAVVDLGLSYNDKPDDVIKALTEFCEHLAEEETLRPNLMSKLEKPRVLGLQSFGDSEITYRILVTTRPGQQWTVAREVRRMLARLVEKHGFTIPFPHRTVYNHAGDAPPKVDAADRQP